MTLVIWEVVGISSPSGGKSSIMFSQRFPASRYSPLPGSSEDAVEASELEKPEQSSVSRHLSRSALRLSGPALLSIILAVALSSGLAGYGLGVVVILNRTNAVQDQGIVPQGELPFHLPFAYCC